jgi:hypothetical protein
MTRELLASYGLLNAIQQRRRSLMAWKKPLEDGRLEVYRIGDGEFVKMM